MSKLQPMKSTIPMQSANGTHARGFCLSDSLEEEAGFVWAGSHLLQEIQPDGRYTYLYTDPDSYEPLAQVRNWTNEDGESKQEIHYFHCDQIGIPREMTDKDGNLLWFGNYTGWGCLKEETKVTDSAYQPFRLQNQYADRETGLHYNFLRYYEPNSGRFITRDLIGLEGGENLYVFGPNVQEWIDPLGLSNAPGTCNNPCDSNSLDWTPHGGKHVPRKNLSWSKIRKSTRNNQPAKYKPEINIESLERTAWADGTSVPSPPGKNVQYRVYDAGKIIGASDGVDTPYIRAECSQGVIHGHPITKEEYLMRLGAN